MLDKIKEAVGFIQDQYKTAPQIGIILGTGLGALVQEIAISHQIEYEQIPHFPVSTVESHKGRLIFGKLAGKEVVVMQGRFHYYEGYTMQQVTFPVRVMKLLGIERLIISNAAGGLNPAHQLSDLMFINDHINLNYANPLTGKNIDELGVRFPDMSEPYSQNMLNKAKQIANKLHIKWQEGVYVSVPGPNLETPAEYKFLRIIGADAVGMSTIPEVIVARQMDVPVFAISVITDLCYEGMLKKVNIEEILAAAAQAEPQMTRLIKELILEV